MQQTQRWLWRTLGMYIPGEMKGVSIWVVESKNITASNPSNNGELFEPAQDKVYRHPTFYKLPDEIKHM